MPPVRLTLPDDLQRRLERLARAANQTLQAFLRDALAREVHRLELTAHEAAEEIGNTFELAPAFDDLTARISGTSPRRPRARRARAST